MNIKICLPPRKRPMTLEDLPDMSALVPVGHWQSVVIFEDNFSAEVRAEPLNRQYSADRLRLADGWGAWRIGDYFAILAKFQVEAPWTLEEVMKMEGSFRVLIFDPGALGVGFRVEDVRLNLSGHRTPDRALIATDGWKDLPRLIVNQETRERVLEVTP